MENALLDKARKFKSEGYDYGKIRSYLSNAGYSEQEITLAFRHLDEEEIHQLYQKQQLNRVKAALLISIITTLLGLVYMLYEYTMYDSISLITLLPVGFFVGTYFEYRRVKRNTFTTREIIREENRRNSWRHTN
ncbi:hypothetical protein [Tunicatimonas pelagia]|uniref:hypothetical protein n=1 Tax=Tunicatimonas pelagia TaxID=931531 RepID=UPI002664F425|nr:hypothetical protein [Tunicatimonas pelagia]WKN45871.1 hypothetical protein P0M28_12970 [Tunicatimonas pelagia]